MDRWWIYTFAILGSIILIYILFYLFNEFLNAHNALCDKCSRNVSKVDDYYYVRHFVEARTRYRCSLHPLKGYRIKYIPSKHYKKMLDRLSDSNKNKLKSTNLLEIIIKDFGFAKIVRTYRKKEKNVSEELMIDKRKLTLDDKKKGIYLITNKVSGKKYVGQSVNIRDRWNQHTASGNDDGFHNILLGHEKEYKFQVLMNCPQEYLDFFEAYYIAHFNSYINGYNLTKGNYSHLTNTQLKILNSMR